MACANSHIDDALQHVSAATRNWRRGAARRCPRAIPIATAQRGQRRARRTVSSADSRTAPRASRTRSRRRDVLKTRPYFQGRKMATFLGPPCGPNSEARKRSRFGCRKTAPVNTASYGWPFFGPENETFFSAPKTRPNCGPENKAVFWPRFRGRKSLQKVAGKVCLRSPFSATLSAAIGPHFWASCRGSHAVPDRTAASRTIHKTQGNRASFNVEALPSQLHRIRHRPSSIPQTNVSQQRSQFPSPENGLIFGSAKTRFRATDPRGPARPAPKERSLVYACARNQRLIRSEHAPSVVNQHPRTIRKPM